MNAMKKSNPNTLQRAALALATLLALSCGLGDSGSSDQQANGGIGGSGFSEGPITEFGSIFVNGIEWFIDDSEIEVDGISGSESDLRIGMVVRVEGEIDRERGTGEATRVFFDDDLEGPVESILEIGTAGLEKELQVLGQRVRIHADDTRFTSDEGGNPGFGFDTIAVDDLVEVSGLIDGDGVIRATHVEFEGRLVLGSSEVELRGEVENYNGSDRFEIGSVLVRIDANTEIEDLPAGGLANGVFVEVEGILIAASEIRAEEIEGEDRFDDDFDDFSITGFVSDFVDVSNFKVAGYAVDASGAEFENGSVDLLDNGVRIEVEGRFVEGVLIASEIEFEGREIRIHAAIAAAGDIDVAGNRFTLLGIPITLTASTELEDDRDDEEPFGIGDFAPGDFFEVEGISDGAGGVIAHEVERDEVDDVRLRGPLDSADEASGKLTILGLEIDTNGSTEFELEDVPVSPSTFFGAVLPGDFVEVKDDEDGDATAIDFASEVERELDEDGDDDDDDDDDSVDDDD